jgi:hypothetical protein
MIQAGGEALWSEIHAFINSIWSREEWPKQWKESILPIYKKGDKIAVIIEKHRRYQLNTKFVPISFSQGHVHMYKKLWIKMGVE